MIISTGRWSSLFPKGCYLTPFIFSLIKDIESDKLKKKIGLMFITKKSVKLTPPKKEKNRKKKMNLSKKGDLVALNRQIC